jgi:hypothetical protein
MQKWLQELASMLGYAYAPVLLLRETCFGFYKSNRQEI